MKQFSLKVSSIICLILTSSYGFAAFNLQLPATFSPNQNSVSKSNSSLASSINRFNQQVKAMRFADIYAMNQSMYAVDKNLKNEQISNSSAFRVIENTSSCFKKTNEFIQNNFEKIPVSLLSSALGMLNNNEIDTILSKQQTLKQTLTIGTPASDTIYSNDPLVIMVGNDRKIGTLTHYNHSKKKITIGPPKINDNDYFNIASILSPLVYTKAKVYAVKSYMQYLTESYHNPAKGLKLSELKTYLNGLSGAEKYTKRYQALTELLTSSAYQNYQLLMRSSMAMKSIGINSFEQLIAQREPSKTKVNGIYNSKNQPIPNPSFLQVEAYQANHRIDNPKWIKNLQTMSPENVQREIALELAVQLHQNYEKEMDNQRLLAILSAMELQSAKNNEMLMQSRVQSVNTVINKIIEKGRRTKS